MSLLAVMLAALPSALAQYAVPALPSNNTPVFEGFVSYSIEFASFPDFAGNKSAPNTFSNNLLDNLAVLIGTKPYIRVGGNTQDYALYDANLKIALNGTINPARSPDYPTTVTIGPSFFESYATWNATKFSHGFNLGLGGNSSAGWQTLLDTAPLACEALGPERLYVWEYGNEPDLYSTSSQGPVRSPSWNEAEYVAQWKNGTRKIKELVAKHCPELATNASYGYMAPSFAGTGNHLRAPKAFQAGLAGDGDIKLFSTHNYISGATSPGVTLQGTLMNHATTKRSVDGHITEYNSLGAAGSSIPLIFGEANSLYNEGKPGLSNSFGAALWGIDFNLYSASVGFRRVHMHQGTNYRYASWQPIQTSKATIGTKPPYYGNVAVAAFLAGSATSKVSVVSVPLSSDQEAAYAAYVDGHLARLMVINLVAYNYTLNGLGPGLNPAARPSYNYTFQLPATVEASSVGVQRLYANGSDALSGITFDGWSYNYELNHGRPVRLSNVTVGETLPVSGGKVTVKVPASQAVILNMAPSLASRCPSP